MAASAKLQLILDLRNNIMNGLSAARTRVNQAVGGMQQRLNELRDGASQVLGDMANRIPVIGNLLGSMLNPYALLTGAILTVGAAYGKSVNMALDWQAQMAEINVTAEQSKEGLDKLSNKLLEIGSRNVMPLEQVPKAFGRIVSAGLDVNTSLEMLEPTMRAAKAGFTDIETVAGAAVSTMMSSGESATRVYDILFETVKEGNAEFKDIAQYLPKIVPLARNVGFALDETAGAYASLTTKLSAEQSTTALQGIMRSLSDPKIVGQFKKIGVSIFDQSGNARPMLEIIKEIEGKMSGLSDRARMIKFDSLGLDQMSTLGFATLTQDVGALEKAISATRDSQGALNKAYEDAKTPLDAWKTVQNEIKAQMISIGQTALPTITEMGEKVLATVNYLKELYRESQLFRDALWAIGRVAQMVWQYVSLPFKALWSLLKGIGDMVNWVGEKIFGLSGGFEAFYMKIKPYLVWIREVLEQIGNIAYDIITLKFGQAFDKIKNFKLPDMEAIKVRVTGEIANPTGEVLGPHLPDFEGFKTTDTNTNNTTVDNLAADAQTIKGNSASKSINVTIGTFFKDTIVNNSENEGLTWDEMQEFLKEKFMGVVRSVETMG